MKHPVWIKNYEENFAQLAKEIGDLRYDSLAEFLHLLGQKITEDGQKDARRGRVKLATSLENAAAEIMKSAKEIEVAWRISKPHMKG
ncbi:MAG: hypothetical protein AAFU03_16420 [Bacteroidota bacterium]